MTIAIHNLREWASDERGTVDDTPYGGGPGMVLKPEPLVAAIEELSVTEGDTHTILLTPQGDPFTQKRAQELATGPAHLILVCGHYEGIDQRVRDLVIDEEVSIGDYVLTGGEIPAMVLTRCHCACAPRRSEKRRRDHRGVISPYMTRRGGDF